MRSAGWVATGASTRAWGDVSHAVFVCTEEEYPRARGGRPHAPQSCLGQLGASTRVEEVAGRDDASIAEHPRGWEMGLNSMSFSSPSGSSTLARKKKRRVRHGAHCAADHPRGWRAFVVTTMPRCKSASIRASGKNARGAPVRRPSRDTSVRAEKEGDTDCLPPAKEAILASKETDHHPPAQMIAGDIPGARGGEADSCGSLLTKGHPREGETKERRHRGKWSIRTRRANREMP